MSLTTFDLQEIETFIPKNFREGIEYRNQTLKFLLSILPGYLKVIASQEPTWKNRRNYKAQVS